MTSETIDKGSGQFCGWCQTELNMTQEQSSLSIITGGICNSCASKTAATDNAADIKGFLATIDAPILLMQSDPRQVFTANKQALELFDKTLSQVEGYRGGQVFDCVNAFTEDGCGKDKNCDDCKIKAAIVDTFSSGDSFQGVSRQLEVKKHNDVRTYQLQISTEKVGDLALVRIDDYRPSN